MLRRVIGWMVAVAYAAVGSRRRVVRRLKNGEMLPVVVHSMPAAQLEKVLGWLKRHGVLDRLWLTFDDGWLVVKDYVPVLEKYNVPAKLFVAPGETVRGNVWTEEANARGIPSETWRSWYSLPESERNDKIGQTCFIISKVKRTLLTKEEVIAFSKHPLIDVENHTWSHLSAVHRPVGEVVAEVAKAQATLVEWTGRKPEWLAWPFGRGTPELDAMMREIGLKAVYTRQGYEIPYCRNMGIEGVTFQENLGRILGAWPKVGETL